MQKLTPASSKTDTNLPLLVQSSKRFRPTQPKWTIHNRPPCSMLSAFGGRRRKNWEDLAGGKSKSSQFCCNSAPNQLVVTFPKKYNFCKQFCERAEVAGQIAEHVCQLVGRRMQLNFATELEATASETEPVRRATTRQRIYEVSERPFARRAMELFDASPQRMEEPGTA